MKDSKTYSLLVFIAQNMPQKMQKELLSWENTPVKRMVKKKIFILIENIRTVIFSMFVYVHKNLFKFFEGNENNN